MHFDLVDLMLFIHVAETSSLTRGAEQSNLSLPAASKRIKNFEEVLELKLLYRTSHGVTLTPAGQTFLHRARLVRQQLDALRGELQQYQAGNRGHVRVFANATTISESLAAVVPQFILNHPGIDIDLQERPNAEILRAAGEGSIDIGVVAGQVQAEGVEVLPYRGERLVLVAPPRHPLSRGGPVPFEATLDYDHIGLSQATALHTLLLDAAGELGRPLRTRMQLGNCDAVCRMVEAGVGVAVLPESPVRRHVQTMAIEIVPLSDAWAFRTLHIVVRSTQALPRHARDLIALLVAADHKGIVA